MQSEDHKKLLQSIKQSKQRSQKVLDNIQSTLQSVKTTIADIHETNDKFDRMKAEYNQVLQKLALKISQSFSNPLKSSGEGDQRQKPSVISMEKAVEEMMNHQQILFVTGAGVSADSGIPTFRGTNGLYDKKFNVEGLQLEPDQFITKQFFQKHSLPIWQWIQSLHQMTTKAKSNETHLLIHECLVELHKKGKKPVLVTQNIDDLHVKPQNGQYEYHAIHGVANLIRCSNLHYQPYSFSKIRQKCPQCNQSLRPHVMFFDESYGIPFGKDVKDREFDFVVIIGSSLSTGLCIKLASSALEVLEINPHPVIQVGNVHPFSSPTGQVLKQMLNCIRKH